MDEEAQQRLIAQATIQSARADAKRAQVNMPIGVVLALAGVCAVFGVLTLPLGLIGSTVVFLIGAVLIPSGVAVIVKSSAAIARSKKTIRELEVPAARVTRS